MIASFILFFSTLSIAAPPSFEDLLALAQPEIPVATAGMPLSDIAVDAPNVVRGSIVKERTVRTEEGFKTKYTFAIYEVYAGKSADMFSTWLPGGTINGVTQDEPGSPHWAEGDEVVLFLNNNGDISERGMFTIKEGVLLDPEGNPGVKLHQVAASLDHKRS